MLDVVTKVQENAEDIYAEAQQINEARVMAEEEAEAACEGENTCEAQAEEGTDEVQD